MDLSELAVPANSPPAPTRTSGWVGDRLITAIALGAFVPGQRLPVERELAQLLGVSRGAVREATQSLAADAYLEIRRGRAGGAFVLRSWGPGSAAPVRRTLEAGWDDLEALFDLRTLIESLIARTAAQRHRKADVASICAAHADYVAAQDRGASHTADQALHTAIAAATQNPYLVQTSLQLRARASLGFLAEPYSERLREVALDHHAALVAAILDRRADDAARIATAHSGLTERALRDVLHRAHAEAPGPDELSE